MKHLSYHSPSSLSLRVIITTLLAIFTLCAQSLNAQGTFLYDQQSSTDETSSFGGVRIQFFGTVGQSFSPSLSSVDFVRLRLYDITPANSLGATVVVNLRANAINGTILSSSTPVSMPNGFVGSANFLFPSTVPVTANSTYFLEVAVQSGDDWGILSLSDTYPSGSFYGGQFPSTGTDLWFREGIVVPEPSAIALCLGSGTFLWFLRRKNQR